MSHRSRWRACRNAPFIMTTLPPTPEPLTLLVTGGAGYIGAHTCVALQQAGYRLVVLDNFCNSRPETLQRSAQITGQAVIGVVGDVRDRALLDRILHEHTIGGVMHFAGLKAVGESSEKPLDYYANNVAGSLVLLQAMQAAGVRTLVFSSSATVSGTPQFLPYTEHHPLTPVNPYGDPNAPISAGGGTYRIRRANSKLSVDHLNTMGLPIYGNYQDADQSAGTTFLPFFNDVRQWTSPEYFVPDGVPYDPCMTNGGCSTALLEAVHDATMQATVYYYDVERIAGGMTQIPIKQVGPNWSPARSRGVAASAPPQPAATVQEDSLVYLPTIVYQQPPEPPPPDDPTNCPCGWFDENGAMFAFVPAP